MVEQNARRAVQPPQPRHPRRRAAARRGAAEVLAANAAAVIDALPQVFIDTDREVRQQAARALLNVDQVAASDLQGPVGAFVQSPAFPDHMEFLFRGLAQISSRLPPNTIDACEQAVATAGEELTDIVAPCASILQYWQWPIAM